MSMTNREECIKHIEAQLESGYLDLGAHDEDEIEIVKEAMALLKVIDKFADIGKPKTPKIKTVDDELHELFALNDKRVDEMINFAKRYDV